LYNARGWPESVTDAAGNTTAMEDMYNFNPGMSDITSGTPDAVNGRFAELGWAQEFKTYGTFTTSITLVDYKPQPGPGPDAKLDPNKKR